MKTLADMIVTVKYRQLGMNGETVERLSHSTDSETARAGSHFQVFK